MASVGFGLVLPVVALVFGGAALGELREDKTLVYLWLRPMDRWPIVVGAAGAAGDDRGSDHDDLDRARRGAHRRR